MTQPLGYDWGAPLNVNRMGNDWGGVPQFNNTQGYSGYPEPLMDSGGLTSLGGPDSINYQSVPVDAGGNAMGGIANWLKNSGFTGSTDAKGIKTDGWGGMALGVAQGLGSAYMGMKQYGLAKDQLAFQKSAYNKNYNAQRQSTNTALEDRQAARVASNAGAYESVGSYMDRNKVR